MSEENGLMDLDRLEVDILEKILSNCNKIWDDINSTEEWKTLRETNHFPIIDDNLLNGLITAIVNLLSFRVFHALKQRYEVRLCVIEMLRSWSRLKGSLSDLNTFSNGNTAEAFVIHILEKHLTDELIRTTNSVKPLMTLYNALNCLLPKNPSLSKHLHRIVSRLAQLELTEESERLLVSISEFQENLSFDELLVEQIYASQRIKFIETPLTKAFTSNVSKLSDSNSCKESIEKDLSTLFDRVVQSPLLFRLTFSLLKEILVASENSEKALNFTQIVLQCIKNRCETREKDIITLYPINLQTCVILLRIDPSNHTSTSRDGALNRLQEIFLINNEDAILLISHYPAWLEIFATFLANNGYDLCND